MKPKGKLRTHTELDVAHLEEMQRLVDHIIAPHCFRKTRAMNLGIGVLALAIGAVCAAVTDQFWVALIFFGIALVFFLRGIFVYRMVATGAWRRMNKDVASNDYILERSYLWAINKKGDFHYPYKDCVRLLETERNFYVIMQSGQAVLLDKSCLEGGTVEDLRAELAEKCGRPAERVGPNWKLTE